MVTDGEAIQAVITTVMHMVHTTMAIHRIMLAALISMELVIIGLNNSDFEQGYNQLIGMHTKLNLVIRAHPLMKIIPNAILWTINMTGIPWRSKSLNDH